MRFLSRLFPRKKEEEPISEVLTEEQQKDMARTAANALEAALIRRIPKYSEDTFQRLSSARNLMPGDEFNLYYKLTLQVIVPKPGNSVSLRVLPDET